MSIFIEIDETCLQTCTNHTNSDMFTQVEQKQKIIKKVNILVNKRTNTQIWNEID